ALRVLVRALKCAGKVGATRVHDPRAQLLNFLAFQRNRTLRQENSGRDTQSFRGKCDPRAMIAGAASDHFFDAAAFQVAGEGEERAARLERARWEYRFVLEVNLSACATQGFRLDQRRRPEMLQQQLLRFAD